MISGLGSLSVAAPAGNIRAAGDVAGTSTPDGGTLNFSGLSNFSANVNNLYVGALASGLPPVNSVNSSAILLPTGATGTGASVITAGSIIIDAGNRSSTNGALTLGKTNTIYADQIKLGAASEIPATRKAWPLPLWPHHA